MLSFFFALLAAILVLPALSLLVLTLAALWSRNRQASSPTQKLAKLTLAVVVPAHNESVHLLPTLRTLLNDIDDYTRVLVVADNCTDDTAAVARLEGVEVIERTNTTLFGKGYALDHGIQHLRLNPPQVLVILDADCLPAPGSIQKIAKLAWSAARPAPA